MHKLLVTAVSSKSLSIQLFKTYRSCLRLARLSALYQFLPRNFDFIKSLLSTAQSPASNLTNPPVTNNPTTMVWIQPLILCASASAGPKDNTAKSTTKPCMKIHACLTAIRDKIEEETRDQMICPSTIAICLTSFTSLVTVPAGSRHATIAKLPMIFK